MTEATLFDLRRLKYDLEDFGFDRVMPRKLREALLNLRKAHRAVLQTGWARNREACRLAEKTFQDALFESGLKKEMIPEYLEFQEVIDRISLLDFRPIARMEYYRAMHPANA